MRSTEALAAPAQLQRRRTATGSSRDRRAVRVAHVLLAFYGAIVLVPILFVAYLSFRSFSGIVAHPLGLPHHLGVANYGIAWSEGHLGQLLVNTGVVAAASVLVIVLFSSWAAYALARFDFRGNRAVYLFFLGGLALPIQLLALPLFILMRQLHLLNDILSLILVFSAGGIAFSVFLLTNFMRGIPRDLEDSAFVDGASYVGVYWHIVLPLVRPTLFIVAIFNLLSAWNNFFFPLILISSPRWMTVPVGILSFVGEHGTAWQLLLPALVIVSLPTVVAFVIVSRQFRRNMLAGATKF